MFDINKIPFSRHGSYLVISPIWKADDDNLYIRSVRGGDTAKEHGKIFKIVPINFEGEKMDYEVHMTETELILLTDTGKIRLCIDNNNTLRIFGNNIGVKLQMECGSYDNAFSVWNNEITVNNFSNDLKVFAKCFDGNMTLEAPWNILNSQYVEINIMPEGKESFYVALKECKTVMERTIKNTSFEDCLKEVENHYNNWAEKISNLPEGYEKGKRLASYITWSAVVSAGENLTRDAMYMSKNWMTNIWSWDNCFNGMAFIKSNPSLAWDQFMIVFDKQLENGLIPDFINDKYDYYSCTKPPIHGWTFLYMLSENPQFFTKEILEEAYNALEKWTDYWFGYTDYDNTGIPSYNHGNDSGWDNSTIFDSGIPLKSPDLLSYLIIQIKALEVISEKLGNHEQARAWEVRYKQELKKLKDTFWEEGKFVYRKYDIGHKKYIGDSLILYLPIILGDLLPPEIIDLLVEGISDENRFFTPYGLASESVSSPLFRENGYWRGPIWAPTTLIIVDGLYRAGHKALAKAIARNFVEMANENGMAENFNPTNGFGLSDKAFTWTSSVFLILLTKYI